MRRSWLTTETWVLIVVFWWSALQMASLVSVDRLGIRLTALSAALMVARTLFKKNRRFGFDPAARASAEFVALVQCAAWILWSFYRRGLTPLLTLDLLVGIGSAYAVCRGWAKQVGVKTQTIHT
jgi:hypothetical protein